jgi:hypothetical protein
MEEYKRVVRLPLTADMDKMKATLSEGLLSIQSEFDRRSFDRPIGLGNMGGLIDYRTSFSTEIREGGL